MHVIILLHGIIPCLCLHATYFGIIYHPLILLYLVDARVVQGVGAGEGELVLLSEVECTGAEEKLTMCDYIGIGDHSCDQENSAGVACGKGRALHISPIIIIIFM